MKVNHRLLWDYHFEEKDRDTDAFKEWYMSRVLTMGSADDIRRAGGASEVRRLFTRLRLPLEVERLWSWYFAIPGPRSDLYGHLDSLPKRFP